MARVDGARAGDRARADPAGGRGVAALACGRVEEFPEDASQHGAEARAEEGTEPPWSEGAENRCGVHRVGSGNLLPIVRSVARRERVVQSEAN